MYLEGNKITQLPNDLFLRLPSLKWIDLRNNQITQIPTNGLSKHNSLRYLLLGGNLIRILPVQLGKHFRYLFFMFRMFRVGKLKGLSALNLDGNPLDHPPYEIVKQGIKAIQQYLRDEHIRRSKFTNEKLDSEDENYAEERDIDMVPDVWASSDEENNGQRRITRSHATTVLSRPSLTLLGKSKYFNSYKIISFTK